MEKIAPTWLFTVGSLTNSAAAISAFVAPRAIWRRTSCSRSVRASTAPPRRCAAGVGAEGAAAPAARPSDRATRPPLATARAGGDDVLRRGVLEHEAGGAGVERVPQHVVVVERREHQHRLAGSPPAATARIAVTPSTRRMRMSISTTSGRCSVDGGRDLVAVAALGDHFEAVAGSEDASDAGPHHRLVVDDHHADHDGDELDRATPWRSGSRPRARHPSAVGPASNDRRAPGPARPCRRGRNAEPEGPAPTPGGHDRRRSGARPSPHGRRESSTRLPGACRATLASPSRATRCTATPTGPASSAADSSIDDLDDEASPAVVVDEGGEVGHPGQRRVGAPFVGPQRGDRGPDLVEARPARPSRRRSSARSASARSPRRSTCRAPVTWSSIAASVCPARSCSSRAMRRRSSATSWSASARRACSSWSINRRWRYTARPRVKMNTLARTHGSHAIPDSGTISSATTNGSGSSDARDDDGRVNDPRWDVALNTIITTRKNAPSSAPSRPTAMTTGTMTSTANTSAGRRGTRPRSTNATTAGASEDRCRGRSPGRSSGRRRR